MAVFSGAQIRRFVVVVVVVVVVLFYKQMKPVSGNNYSQANSCVRFGSPLNIKH